MHVNNQLFNGLICVHLYKMSPVYPFIIHSLLLPGTSPVNVSLYTLRRFCSQLLQLHPIQSFCFFYKPHPFRTPPYLVGTNPPFFFFFFFLCFQRASKFPHCDVMIASDRRYNLIVTHPPHFHPLYFWLPMSSHLLRWLHLRYRKLCV